jgi:hypothetical protein
MGSREEKLAFLHEQIDPLGPDEKERLSHVCVVGRLPAPLEELPDADLEDMAQTIKRFMRWVRTG